MKSTRYTIIAVTVLLLFSSVSFGQIGNISRDSPTESATALKDENRSNDSYPFSDHYPTVSEIYNWYDDLEANHSDIVKKIHYGQSYEGRPLYILKISDNVETDEDEPEVVINGGTHAREWSGHQTSAYFLWRIVNEYDTNETIHWLVNNREIFVACVINPDGYIYDGNGDLSAYEGAGWRKNRNESTPTDSVGVDLNRNWDIDWESGEDDPSADDYHGEAPFSEPEIKTFSNWMKGRDIESYQDIHSFAGTLLIPWCYTGDPSPHDTFYREAAKDMTSLTSMLGDNSSHYSYGQPDEEIGYSASGGSIDWVYDELGSQGYCFEIETGGSQFNAGEGFHPPEEDIMTINRDIDDALIYQSRIADIELYEGDTQASPPNPYLVYGTVEDSGTPIEGKKVTIENGNTGEEISVDTDGNGYYELNLGMLTENGYSDSDSFQIFTGGTSRSFSIGDEWGRRIDLNYTEPQTFDYQLESGWNYVSLDCVPEDNSLSAILGSNQSGIAGKYDKVMYYENPYRLVDETIWEDGFENTSNWNVSDGEWEIGEPQALGGSSGNPDPNNPFSGDNLLGYDLSGDGDYEDGISTTYWATSPSIDLSDKRGVELQFQRWLNVETSDNDHAYIEVYNGSSWKRIWSNPTSTITDDDWYKMEFNVSTYADDNPNFRIRFGMGPTDNPWLTSSKYSGWNIDEIRITSEVYQKKDTQGWKTYVPDRAEHFNTLSKWDESMGIWIHMKSSGTLSVPGYTLPSSTSIMLKPGWNMVGYPSTTNRTAVEVLPAKVDKIGVFDGSREYNIRYIEDLSTYTMRPEEGYWVHSSADRGIEWTVEDA